MLRTRILLFLLGIILVPAATIGVIWFAKGYHTDPKTGQITSSGILSANSIPDGSQVIINGALKSVTNANIYLSPGKYQIQIKKDGYSSWQKTIPIEAEAVNRVYPVLFPSVPSLKSISFSGSILPTQSHDGNKVAYLVPNKTTSKLFTVDLYESALGSLNRESKLIATLPRPNYNQITWSPDNKQLLIMATGSSTLVDLNENRISEGLDQALILSEWQKIIDDKDLIKRNDLPALLRETISSSAANLIWSPRENKLMYTATASATIPHQLTIPLPGSNPTPESRNLEIGQRYVYDIEEDRNYNISNIQCLISNIRWFADSNHLFCAQDKKIIIMEYDGTNSTVVYSGPMEPGFTAAYSNSKYILILTNLGQTSPAIPNLYAISLR